MTLRAVRGLLLAVLLCGTTGGWASQELTGARVHRAPDHTRVVLDVTGPTRYTIRRVAAREGRPFRLAIDLADTRLASPDALHGVAIDGTVLRALRSGRHAGFLRVVLDLDSALAHRDFTLPAVAPYGDRIVIDLLDSQSAAAHNATPAPALSPRPALRDIVIAIDAGHGGVDPGAVGVDGILEKDVTFAIARRIAEQIDRHDGFRAGLVRTGDYYVPLRKRTVLAREQQAADLFISVHADAFRTAAARGASIYTLSAGGASSETARWLAQKENQADLVGGVSLDAYEGPVRKVLLDLSMDQTLADSQAVGRAVLGELDRITRLHSPRVEQAGFVVLKSPDIPSILIESGYLSNPAEARRLASAGFQNQLARAVSRGVVAWFQDNPPPGTHVAARKTAREATVAYVIKRGDTLSAIAQRHSVRIARLRELNNLAGDRLRVGQTIRVPAL